MAPWLEVWWFVVDLAMIDAVRILGSGDRERLLSHGRQNNGRALQAAWLVIESQREVKTGD